MGLKRSWAKVLSSVLAVTVTFSTWGSMPVIANAQENVEVRGGVEPLADEAFTEIGNVGINYGNDSVTLDKAGGDHFAIYNGCNTPVTAFTWEADVKLEDSGVSAGLIVAENKNDPIGKWYGANINTTEKYDKEGDEQSDGRFRIFGPDNLSNQHPLWDDFDSTALLHLKLDVDVEGNYTYSFGNASDTELKSLDGTIPNWNGGYVGILTFDTKATFSNWKFKNNTETLEPNGQFRTNLDGLTLNANWKVTDEGLYSNAIDKGDSFMYSTTEGTNFVYSTDVTFKQNKGAAALIFRKSDGSNASYAVNIDASNKKCKFWKWENNQNGVLDATQLMDEKEVAPTSDNKYTLKVVAIDSWISYYVNDTLIASTGDYILQGVKGQNTVYKDGFFGLLNWNGEMVFQNTYYAEIDESNTPLLNNITITSSDGDVEGKSQFVPTEPITLQYVKNNAETVSVGVDKCTDDATITIKDETGKEYNSGGPIPVKEGRNYITIESSVKTGENDLEAKLTYRVNVHRRQPDEIYYNELYRGQYHYSIKDGWGNDPNGMVYYKGKYHLYHQFYDDIIWGPMHWIHLTSTDMIHWEEKPVTLYPDANGTMFSGCIVIDEENTSGFFDGIEGGGLVALITADGNGQRIKLAYSTDEGDTWTKVDEIAADWTNDPLKVDAFRDPKVFRWENKWFMVIAGGPLRIYSSDNLKEWKCESTYKDLHTECPDLYPIEADDGELKWVLSRGGRFYEIGDFKEVDGNWTFVPDSNYDLNKESGNGVMNFGHDSYAAMTFYIQDFGTKASPTLPEIIEINWMNTWNDYCNNVAQHTGEKFNGTYNLLLKLGVKKDGDKYVLTQTPIDGYEDLRDTAAVEIKSAKVSADNDLLKDFKGDCYEIVSKFTPAAGTEKVGFKLRTGSNEETLVVYDVTKKKLSVDRSKSGIVSISNQFQNIDSQEAVTLNDDGTIDLHIYVDRASVEVFAKEHTVACGEQIFPSINSMGASVLVEGEAATADITIYPMNSIWEDKIEPTNPIRIASASSSENKINIGSKLDLSAYLLPIGVEQDITWSVDNENILSIEPDADNNTVCHINGIAKGTATVTATATNKKELTKAFKISVSENNFDTNIDEFTANGNWFIDGEILQVSNTSANASYMTVEKIPSKEYTLETSLKWQKGLINIFFASESTNPNGAYAIQLGGSNNIRLFYMAGADIKTEDMGKSFNDNTFHDIKIDKTQDSVTVSIDGKEYLTHKFDSVENFYNDAHVGLGLWDGALEVKKFRVNYEGQTEPSSEPSSNPSSEPDSKQNYTVTFDTSAVKNAKVSIQKGEETFKSGDSVNADDKLQLIITPNENYVFSKVPVVTADNASVGAAIVKDGSYTFAIHAFRKATNVTVSCETLEKQFEITLSDKVKEYIESNAHITAELDFTAVTSESTSKLIITPEDGYAITSAKASISGNTCKVSEAEKIANGVYVITFSEFTADTEVVSLTVETEVAEVKENGTAVETNVGEANLSKTEFKEIEAEIKKDVVSALQNMLDGTLTDKQKEDLQKAIEAITNNSAFIEIALTVNEKKSGITQTEVDERNIEIDEIKTEVQKGNANSDVEVKAAMNLDISLFSVCKDKTSKDKIAETALSELTKPVKISMKVPSSISEVKNGAKRTYYIICLHKKNGEIKRSKVKCDYDSTNNMISFDASKFSTYILCYADVTSKSINNSTGSNGSSGVVLGYVTSTPSAAPSTTPSATPSATPSVKPSATPSAAPSTTPSTTPVPSQKPSVTGNPVPTVTPAVPSKVMKGTKVTVKGISYKVTSIGSTKTVKCISAKNNIKKAVIPASVKISGKKYKVTAIAKNVFKNHKKLVKVTVGKNIQSIDKNVFKGCKNLKNIVIKTKKLTAKKTGNNVFKGINSNATVKVPKGKVKAYEKIVKSKGAGKNVKVTK